MLGEVLRPTKLVEDSEGHLHGGKAPFWSRERLRLLLQKLKLELPVQLPPRITTAPAPPTPL